MHRTVPLAIFLAAGSAAFCGAPAPLRYAAERGRDLLDVVEINAGIGRGAKLDLRYGLHLFGAGRVRAWRVGTIDRRVGRWRELDDQFAILPLSLLAWPIHHAARLCGARSLAADARFVAEAGSEGVQHLDRKELNGDPAFILKDTVEGPNHTRWADSFPIGAEAHLGVGLRIMVRPLQLVDFLVGFAGVDLDPWLNETRR